MGIRGCGLGEFSLREFRGCGGLLVRGLSCGRRGGMRGGVRGVGGVNKNGEGGRETGEKASGGSGGRGGGRRRRWRRHGGGGGGPAAGRKLKDGREGKKLATAQVFVQRSSTTNSVG